MSAYICLIRENGAYVRIRVEADNAYEAAQLAQQRNDGPVAISIHDVEPELDDAPELHPYAAAMHSLLLRVKGELKLATPGDERDLMGEVSELLAMIRIDLAQHAARAVA